MLSPIQDDVKLIQDECKAILGLDTDPFLQLSASTSSVLVQFKPHFRPV
ncbi:hypothetical protein [Desertivirga arenae]|nr:hypothetical protein [Pedobacter sp. SYSU D00823]